MLRSLRLPVRYTVRSTGSHAEECHTYMQTRFPEINISSKDAQLAEVFNPRFNLDWLDDQAEKNQNDFIIERASCSTAL